MPSDPLQPIRAALKAGDQPTAQALLRPLLKQHPTAEVWVLAAHACATEAKALTCLRRALDLDPQHGAANRMLLKLEGAKPPPADEQPTVEMLAAGMNDEFAAPLKTVKRKKRRSATRTIVLLSLLLFGMSCSLLTMNMVGLISGPITLVTQLTGGASPVSQLDGKPLSQVIDAPVRVQPAQTEPLEARDADVIEPGYVHEYTFAGHSGTDVAIYVQFLSLAANRVSRNVVVLRPDDSDATPGCDRGTILEGDNNITLTCGIDVNGTWKVRILGREGESVGAYFVGVEQMRG